jgi:hypothetical protein
MVEEPRWTAEAAVAVLSAYLTVSRDNVSGRESVLADKANTLYETIKNKFEADPDAEETLAFFEKRPEVPNRKAAFEVAFARMMTDSDFASTIEKLLLETMEADSESTISWPERGEIRLTGIHSTAISTGDIRSTQPPIEG